MKRYAWEAPKIKAPPPVVYVEVYRTLPKMLCCGGNNSKLEVIASCAKHGIKEGAGVGLKLYMGSRSAWCSTCRQHDFKEVFREASNGKGYQRAGFFSRQATGYLHLFGGGGTKTDLTRAVKIRKEVVHRLRKLGYACIVEGQLFEPLVKIKTREDVLYGISRTCPMHSDYCKGQRSALRLIFP